MVEMKHSENTELGECSDPLLFKRGEFNRPGPFSSPLQRSSRDLNSLLPFLCDIPFSLLTPLLRKRRQRSFSQSLLHSNHQQQVIPSEMEFVFLNERASSSPRITEGK